MTASDFGRVERFSLRKLDQHVNRIGAGQFHVEPLAGRNRLLAVGHLIGEPVARLKLQIAE